MFKLFGAGLTASALLFGSVARTNAADITGSQAEALRACSAAQLKADNGAACAIALAALPPGAFALIKALLEAGAGAELALLNQAVSSSLVSTASIGTPPTGTSFDLGTDTGGGPPTAS